MGQEIAIKEEGTVATSATPYSLTSLLALVPDWLGRDLFEADRYTLPQIVPEDGPRQLRDAASRFMDSLTDFAERKYLGERTENGKKRHFFDDPMDVILGELRLRTVIRNEHQEEARGRFRLLRDDCRRHAIEVVREAATEYARSEKFFPAGYAELRPFIVAAENARSRRAYHLRQLAKDADAAAERRLRGDDEPADPAEVKALLDEMRAKAGMTAEEAGKRDYSNLRTPTADELAALASEAKV